MKQCQCSERLRRQTHFFLWPRAFLSDRFLRLCKEATVILSSSPEEEEDEPEGDFEREAERASEREDGI